MHQARLAKIVPLALLTCAVPGLARAANPEPSAYELPGTSTPQIDDGVNATTCSWPTVVAVTGGGGLCTGTLIDEQVVLYAAHCGGGNKTISFGEGGSTGRSVGTQYCTANPEFSDVNDNPNVDWAFCVLDSPVTDVPITPALVGCNIDDIPIGTDAVISGFGQAISGPSGLKRWAASRIISFNLNYDVGGIVRVGAPPDFPAICSGDSGGPAFGRMRDGAWHVFGIASFGPVSGCGTNSSPHGHALVWDAIPWVEQQTGIDVTPCTDADGAWNPDPRCGGFFAGGTGGSGTWDTWCSGTPASGPSDTCGAPFGTEPETDAPTVRITAPEDGSIVEAETEIDIVGEATDNGGYGVFRVYLEVDGQTIGDTRDPSAGDPKDLAQYTFSGAKFPAGEYEIALIAEDYLGNLGSSAPYRLCVGTSECEPLDAPDPDDGGGGDNGDDFGISGGTDSAGGGGDGGDGCSVVTPLDPRGALASLALFGLVGLSRRRRQKA